MLQQRPPPSSGELICFWCCVDPRPKKNSCTHVCKHTHTEKKEVGGVHLELCWRSEQKTKTKVERLIPFFRWCIYFCSSSETVLNMFVYCLELIRKKMTHFQKLKYSSIVLFFFFTLHQETNNCHVMFFFLLLKKRSPHKTLPDPPCSATKFTPDIYKAGFCAPSVLAGR